MRTVVKNGADGSPIKRADAPGGYIEWSLEYTHLSDGELTALQQFFAAAEGTLNPFTFLDPTSNLLAQSDHLGNAVWTRGPLLTTTAGVADPNLGTNGWRFINTGGGGQ